MPVDPKQIRNVFLDAAELPMADRAAFLTDRCGDDGEFRAAVDRLLAAHEEPASLLSRPAPGMPTAVQVQISERPGTMIGPYKLLEQIGEGGMGTVWMAQQTEPVKRLVALKLIKAGMDSKQVIARFEAERQALAIMDHPNIARVLQAGTTVAGRPYFVMEFVKGVPITEFCDQNQLTPRQRLELFVAVCQAVQHAHQKGIIHRDLKPSNVLVSRHDTTPVVKVIDFGVAKALGQELTDKTLLTGVAQMVGTPLYMSPEQAGMSDLDVDTRSDIYSLGVLLYELLTGTTPIPKERFRKAAYDEIRRIIREEEPPKPSTRLSDSKSVLPSISAMRHTEPARLTKLVRGELDWIVMKALEKDRGRRYETANGFAMDVQRYLADETVQACPPSAGYRLRKFARRNKGPVLAVSLVFLALVAGFAGTAWQALRAERALQAESERADAERQAKLEAQRREAETRAVLAFIESWVLGATRGDGWTGDGLGQDVTLRQAVEEALPFIAPSFADQPLIEARLRLSLARLLHSVVEVKLAAEQAEAARAIYAEHRGPDHPGTLASMTLIAECFHSLERHAEGLRLNEETLSRRKAKLGPDHPDTLASMMDLADSYNWLERFAEADRVREEARALLDRSRASLDPNHPDALANLSKLADGYERLNAHAEEVELVEKVLALQRGKLGHDHLGTLATTTRLVPLYMGVGRLEDALKPGEEMLRLCRAKLGPAHSRTIGALNVIRNIYAGLGRDAESQKVLAEALALKGGRDDERRNMAAGMERVGDGYARLGRHPEAAAHYSRSLELSVEVVDPKDRALTAGKLGEVLLGAGKVQEAEARFAEAVRLCDCSEVLRGIGNAYARHGQWKKAADVFRIALDQNPKSGASYCGLAQALRKQGKVPEAIVAYERAIELEPNNAAHHNNFGAMLCDDLREYDKAIACFRKAIELDPKGANVHSNLGIALSSKSLSLISSPDPKDRDPKRAIEAALEAVAFDPRSIHAWQYLGWARYRAGDWPRCLEALEKSCKLEKGGDHGQWFVMALAHARLAPQDGLPEKERDYHHAEARRRYEQAEKQAGVIGVRPPTGGMAQAVWDFRAEARELIGSKNGKK